jgi:hypothetical protein
VALDDGKELSPKAECVEEASSVRAVRYCSRECRQADWKKHKPAYAAAHTRELTARP